MKIHKNLFKRAIKIILLTIAVILLINLCANDLIVNGFDSFFTINAYKEAFKLCEADIMFINVLRCLSTAITLVVSYTYLSYNIELLRLQRKTKEKLRKEGYSWTQINYAIQ